MIDGGGATGKCFAVIALWFSLICVSSLCSGFALRPAYAKGEGYYLVRQRGPGGAVHSVSVDRQGFVWSAGERGTCRFDGLNTRCLSYGSAKFVFASKTSDDVWALFSNGTLRKISPPASLKSQWQVPGTATGLVVTRDRVWVSSSSGLFVIEIEPQPQELRALTNSPIQSLAVASGAAVFALTDGQVFRHEGNLQPERVSIHASNKPLLRLFGAVDGEWLAATSGDVLRPDKGVKTVSRLDLGSSFKSPALSAMKTKDSSYWVGVAGGLLHLRAEAHEAIAVGGLPFTSPNFAVNAIDASDVDRVWLGTPVGLYEVQARVAGTTISHASGDDIAIAFAVAPASPSGVWFSSDEGVNWMSGSWLRKFGRAEGLKVPDLRAVAVDRHADVWVGGLGSGLFKFDSLHDRFIQQTAIWQGGLRAIVPSRDGGIWLGLVDSGLVRVQNSRTQVLIPPASNGANEVLDMLETEDGSLWVTFRSGGVGVLKQGVLTNFVLPIEDRSVELLSLLEDGEGGMLLGSNGKGLFRIANGALQKMSTANGLADDHIFGMTTDRQGRLWISFQHGISYAPLSDVLEALKGTRHAIHSVVWGRDEGITGEPIRAFSKSATTLFDGTLAFPALDGLIRIDPALIRATSPPEVVLDEVEFQSASTNANLREDFLQFSDQRPQLRFMFSAPKHPRPQRLNFRFRLLGHETTWRAKLGEGEARYSGVAPGTYHFEVQAEATPEDGGPSLVVSATVHILPPWYSTWTFRLLTLALAGTAIFWRHRMRKASTAELLNTRLAERRRIATDIHDGLSQDLVGVRLQIEAAQASLKKDPNATGKCLQRATLLLDDGFKDLRDSIWGLNHDDVDTDTLASGLRERLELSTKDTAVMLIFESQGLRCLVAPAVAWQITQIAREAVANAIKHAAAQNITVTFSTHEGRIVLAVNDDGRGIDRSLSTPGVGQGFGLAGMKARAVALGAVLKIQNNPAGGTHVELIVPGTTPS